MTINNEITINLDAKKIVAITLLTILSVYTLYTYSAALYAFVAPDNTKLVRVTNFDAYDPSDNSPANFAVGTTVTVKASVERATAYTSPSYSVVSSTSTAKITVSVYYANAGTIEILNFYTASVTLTPGVPHNINLAKSVTKTGSYTAKIFVWDDYLPSGGNVIIDTGNSVATITTYTGV
jgi:hypothetical protein